jgi:imidazolonepropionase-like amidohydrolase
VVEPGALARFGERPKGWAIPGFQGMEANEDAYTENIRVNIQALAAAGVPFFAGTDTGLMGLFPGAALHSELKAIVSLGFSPQRALAAATSAPADFLDPKRGFGRVAPGQRADLLLVRGDPSIDISSIDQIEAVYLDGARLERLRAPQ